MPPAPTVNAFGWKAFFALLMILQTVALGVLWRTYDAVSETSRLTALHEYQIREVILPDIKELKTDAQRRVVRSN